MPLPIFSIYLEILNVKMMPQRERQRYNKVSWNVQNIDSSLLLKENISSNANVIDVIVTP